MLLSQNIESGALEFKPVLKTTLRPPSKTLQFTTTSGNSIEATLGHFWWIAGKGWVRTKELEVGMPMHHAKGTSKIVSIEETPKEVETYNLVVADSHTYFVGTERLLSWDATEVQPTLQLVPGLPAPVLAKK
jgi:intein/homing endonuclease